MSKGILFHSRFYQIVFKNLIKRYLHIEGKNEYFEDEVRYKELFSDTYIRPISGNRVIAIQPDWKFMSKKFKNTTSELRLNELVALIESIPNWSVEQKAIYSIKQDNKNHLFGKGQIEEMAKLVKSNKNLSAVVIGADMLNSTQLAHLQEKLSLPVYDRYTIVLQIFQSRARTGEAKLQVALAEIPYLRSRLHGMHSGELDKQIGSLKFLGGTSEVLIDTRLQLLHDREIKIKAELEKLSSNRLMMSSRRKRLQLPTVAVVGYTNAGKTSLIKLLSGDESLRPRDQLFATLDLTAHSVVLPNRNKLLMYDTVGFITDMPPSLLSSFRATLQDIATCDVLLHIHDASHPDATMQLNSVRETLLSLPNMHSSLLDGIITAHNKVDLLSEHDRQHLKEIVSGKDILISVKEGSGMDDLMNILNQSVNQSTGRIKKVFKVPANGPLIEWLYKEAVVERVDFDKSDSDKFLVHVVITPSSLAKFEHKFKRVR